jgi:hypothetical protein
MDTPAARQTRRRAGGNGPEILKKYAEWEKAVKTAEALWRVVTRCRPPRRFHLGWRTSNREAKRLQGQWQAVEIQAKGKKGWRPRSARWRAVRPGRPTKRRIGEFHESDQVQDGRKGIQLHSTGSLRVLAQLIAYPIAFLLASVRREIGLAPVIPGFFSESSSEDFRYEFYNRARI